VYRNLSIFFWYEHGNNYSSEICFAVDLSFAHIWMVKCLMHNPCQETFCLFSYWLLMTLISCCEIFIGYWWHWLHVRCCTSGPNYNSGRIQTSIIAHTQIAAWQKDERKEATSVVLLLQDNLPLHVQATPGVSCYSDWLRAGRCGDRVPAWAKFFVPVQAVPEAQPASCAMGTGLIQG